MKKLIVVLALLLMVSMVAMAQEEKVQLFGGYQFTSVDLDGRVSVPKGWDADLQLKPTKHVGFVADFSGAYKDGFSFHNIAGGVRFSAPSKVTPFAETLIGVAVLNHGGGNHLSWMIGGGVDVNINKNFAFRLAKFDYDFVRAFGHNSNNFRYATGIVAKW